MPPFLTWLVLEKPLTTLEFYLLGELKNVCFNIPLLQAIKNIPIYAKAIKEFCIWRTERKPKDPSTIHVVGKLAYLIMGKPFTAKYEDTEIPIIIV